MFTYWDHYSQQILSAHLERNKHIITHTHPKSCICTEQNPKTCLKLFTSSTAQGGGGSFKNRKPIGEVGCCESGMAERSHWRTERCLICLTLSISFSGYLPTYLSIFYVSIYLLTYLPIDLSIYLSIFQLSSCLPVCLSVYLSIYLSTSLSSVYLSSCLPVYLSIYHPHPLTRAFFLWGGPYYMYLTFCGVFLGGVNCNLKSLRYQKFRFWKGEKCKFWPP